MTSEEARKYKREWAAKQRAKDPEGMRAKLREWRAKNKEKLALQYARNDKKRREKYALDPEPMKKRAKVWRDANLAKAREMARLYAAQNRGAAVARAVQWQKDNPEKVATRTALRRSRKKNAPGYFSKAEWVSRLVEFNRRCAYCLRPQPRLHVEHVTPLVRGGSNSIENIVPACKSCNARKGARGPLSMIGGW